MLTHDAQRSRSSTPNIYDPEFVVDHHAPPYVWLRSRIGPQAGSERLAGAPADREHDGHARAPEFNVFPDTNEVWVRDCVPGHDMPAGAYDVRAHLPDADC